MNYGRNMPDWQQYGALQSGESDGSRQVSATSNGPVVVQQAQAAQQAPQTVQPGAGSGGSGGGASGSHLFNLDCMSKPQNDPGAYYRSGQQQPASSPLGQAGMLPHHHMGYGPIIDPANTMGPDELQQQQQQQHHHQQQQQQQQHQQQQQQRNVQMSLSSPTSRMPANPMAVNSAAMAGMGQIMPPGPPPPTAARQPAYTACKGDCCQPNNIGYRWSKMNPYQASNPYRDSVHPAASTYATMDGRTTRYSRTEMYRKETMPGFPVDQQQQHQQAAAAAAAAAQVQHQQHRRYRKESSQVQRAYHQSAMPPNYPAMPQNAYGYPPAEYQKYYGGMKDGYGRTVPPPHAAATMMKYPDPSMQDKYLPKQQYQPNGAMMQNGMMVNAGNIPTNMTSPYYNPQMARDLPSEFPCKAPDGKDQDGCLSTQMQQLATKHQHMYHQKLAMQRIGLEASMREFSRLHGYQNHPRYQECLMKYREIIRLQQSAEYQATGMQPPMQAQQAAATVPPPAPSIPSINLQFDQNGVLINSSLMPGYNPGMQGMAQMANPLSPGKDAANPYDGKAMQAMEHAMACNQQQQQQQQQQIATSAAGPHAMLLPDQHQQQHIHHPHYLPQEYHPAVHHHPQQRQMEEEAAASAEAQQQKASKDFADKPELDVRQFLANWDETEEEDGVNGNLQNVILTDSAPIVVLEYENLNLAGDNLTAQAICVSAPEKEASTVALALPAQNSPEKDQIATANTSEAASTAAPAPPVATTSVEQAAIPTTVNIIRCITSGGCDEVPTIHIVESLENEAVVKKIENAFHSLNSADIKSIEDLVNKSSVAASSGNKEERISLSFLNATTILQTKETNDKTAEEANSGNDAGSTSKPSNDQPTSSEKKDATVEKSGVVNDSNNSNNLNLGNASFVNEDTRNHDDLSLPELPTSECTPISTTLNTPNHSDNEESSERVRVMSISTNSMEIMPSSPIISFAHSPIKFQKTAAGDELQFDFQNSNEGSNSVIKDNNAGGQNIIKETSDKGIEENKTQTDKNTAPTTNAIPPPEPHCSSVIDTAVFGFSEFSNSSSLQLSEEPKMPVPPMEGNCLTSIIKDTPPITDLKVLDSDDDLVGKVSDIWMDINLEGSLSSSSSKLLTSEEKQAQTDNLKKKTNKTSLRHFRKIKGGVNYILENPPATKEAPKEVIVPTVEKVVKLKETPPIVNTKPAEIGRQARKSLDSSLKSVTPEKSKKRAKSVELDSNSNHDQEELLKEFKDLKRKRSIGQIQDEIAMLKSSLNELQNSTNNDNNSANNNVNNNAKNKLNNPSSSPNINANNNVSDTANNCTTNDGNNVSISSNNDSPSSDSNVCRNSSLPMLPDTKITTSRRSFSSIFDPIETDLEKAPEEISTKNCVDSDIKIQLSNVNLQIKDKKETNSSTVCNNNSSTDGIKIEINVSRVESQRLHDNEVVSKSNQHLNISLPPKSPVSCKVDCQTSISTVVEEKETVKLENPALPEKEMVEVKLTTNDKENVKSNTENEETKEEEETLVFVNKNVELEDAKSVSSEKSNASHNNSKKETEVDNIIQKKLDKKEFDIENALKKLEECRRDSIHDIEDENVPLKEPECIQNKSFVDTPEPGCSKDLSKDLDFDNFDVEPFDDKSDDYLKDLFVNSDSRDYYKNHNSNSTSKTVGYLNPLFYLEELETLNTVPVYTTKDGKITYSPNPNYTYRALIIEARQREGHALFRDYYGKGNRRSRRYSSPKSQDESYKYYYSRKYAKSSNHKYKYDGKKDDFNDDVGLLSFENCLTSEGLSITDKKMHDEVEELKDSSKKEEAEKTVDKRIQDNESIIANKFSIDGIEKENTAFLGETRLSPIHLTPPSLVLKNNSANRSIHTLEGTVDKKRKRFSSSERETGNLKREKKCIVDLQNLKEDILKKLNDQEPQCTSRLEDIESQMNTSVLSSTKNSEKENEKQSDLTNKKKEVILGNVTKTLFDNEEKSKSDNAKEILEEKETKQNDRTIEEKETNQSDKISEEKETQENNIDDKTKSIENTKKIDMPLVEIENLAEMPATSKDAAEVKIVSSDTITSIEVAQEEVEIENTVSAKETNNETKITEEAPVPVPIKLCKTVEELLDSSESTETEIIIPEPTTTGGIEPKVPENNKSIIIGSNVEETTQSSQIENKFEEPIESSLIENKTEESRESSLIENKTEESRESSLIENKTEESRESSLIENQLEMSREASLIENNSEECTESSLIENQLQMSRKASLVENKSEECTESSVIENKLEESTESSLDKSNAEEFNESIHIDSKALELPKLIEIESKMQEPRIPNENDSKTIEPPKLFPIINAFVKHKDANEKKVLENFEIKKEINFSPTKKEEIIINKVESLSDQETNEKPISPKCSLRLPISIDKSNFDFDLCDRFIKQEKLHASRIDAIVKTVPKLVLRKSDTNPKIFSKSKSIDNGTLEDLKKESQESIKSPVHPKIPKMIIRNARSRPATPSIEEISESSCSSSPDSEPKTFKVKFKLDDKSELQKLQNSCDSTEAKIPKMKIKLEEKLPRVVIENIDLSSIEQKTVPKMKITNVKGSVPKIMEKQTSLLNDDKSDTNSSLPDYETTRVKEKSSSKSRSKKDSPNYLSSSESEKKRSSSSSYSQSKKTKRSPKEEVNLDPNLEDTQFLLENEYRQRNNSNSCSTLTKIPKVIIKRTSPSAEFKCELSKDAIVNAQPQVVLRRSWVLDCMAKDARHMKLLVKVAPSKEEVKQENKPESNELEWQRFISGLKRRRELSRSNSTSDLNRFSPVKIKRRRVSDNAIGTFDYSDSDSSTRFAFTKKKLESEAEALNVHMQKMSSNATSEDNSFNAAKTYWKSVDENMNSKSKIDFESEEDKPKIFSNNKLEPIVEASNSLSSEILDLKDKSSDEKTDSSLIDLHTIDDDNLLHDKDVDVHEEEIDGTTDDFETNESSIIKVESSDESQTTIEIMPASPDLSHELDVEQQKENVLEEQIYSEDAIPMHFEYELEVGETANDPLEVPLPSSEGEADKSSLSESQQITGILIPEQLAGEVIVVPSSKSDISTSNSCSENQQDPIRLVDETSSTSNSLNNNPNSLSNSGEMTTTTTTEEDEDSSKMSGVTAACSYSDLLVKEVLAAKETLKKYIGNLTSGNGESCNSTDFGSKSNEKKQSTSFDRDSLTKYGIKSSNFKHRDKRKRISRGKSRSRDVRTSRTSSSNRNNDTLSSSRLSSIKSSHRKSSDPSKEEEFRTKSSKHSKSQVDPLAHLVEENLRHSQQRENKAEDKAETISNRDVTRNLSVIANSANAEVLNNDLVDEVPKLVENVISRSDEANLTKSKALQLSPEMTTSSIVRELVFHDKATIRHRRYCMLCERWFPSTLRHRRHLAGYQHRHTELTQRRAIHMLFLIFTGKLCPKLLPPNIVRTDCVPGELTPLQIAVQDFATVFDGMQQVTGKQTDETKE